MEVIQTTSMGFVLIKLFLFNVPILHPLETAENLIAPLPLIVNFQQILQTGLVFVLLTLNK